MERKYKDAGNKVHQIDERFAHLLPPGCVEITDAEADALLAPTAEQLAAEAKAAAVARIGEIRLELIEHLAATVAGTPQEQAQAKSAIGLLRAEAALAKAKV